MLLHPRLSIYPLCPDKWQKILRFLSATVFFFCIFFLHIFLQFRSPSASTQRLCWSYSTFHFVYSTSIEYPLCLVHFIIVCCMRLLLDAVGCCWMLFYLCIYVYTEAQRMKTNKHIIVWNVCSRAQMNMCVCVCIVVFVIVLANPNCMRTLRFLRKNTHRK